MLEEITINEEIAQRRELNSLLFKVKYLPGGAYAVWREDKNSTHESLFTLPEVILVEAMKITFYVTALSFINSYIEQVLR